MTMKRVAVGVLATTLGASAALAQTAKPSPYEGMANPPNTTEDVQTSTETTMPAAQSANTPPVARYVIPGEPSQPAVASAPNTYARPQLKEPVAVDPYAGMVTF